MGVNSLHAKQSKTGNPRCSVLNGDIHIGPIRYDAAH